MTFCVEPLPALLSSVHVHDEMAADIGVGYSNGQF